MYDGTFYKTEFIGNASSLEQAEDLIRSDVDSLYFPPEVRHSYLVRHIPVGLRNSPFDAIEDHVYEIQDGTVVKRGSGDLFHSGDFCEFFWWNKLYFGIVIDIDYDGNYLIASKMEGKGYDQTTVPPSDVFAPHYRAHPATKRKLLNILATYDGANQL